MDIVTTWFDSLPFKVQIYYALAIFFLLVSLSFVLIILISQGLKAVTRRHKFKYQEDIRNEISLMVVQATMSDIPEASFIYKLKNLQSLRKKSTFLAQLILDEILSMKKNLVGEGSVYLKRMYLELGLHELSIKKVKSRNWKKIAKGLRELELMEQEDSTHYFIGYLNHSNYYLRREARLGLAGLAQNPMFFLDEFEESLSELEQLLLFQKLKSRPREVIPDFSRWYHNKNYSVVTFCVEMTEQFAQVHNVPKLAKLLKSANPKVACMIVGALQRMEAIQCLDMVVSMLSRTNSYKVAIGCLQFIGSVGDVSSKEVILPYVKHYNPMVRLEAVRALEEIGGLEENLLDPEVQSMVSHVKHPLIV